jgi:hypothetical protein
MSVLLNIYIISFVVAVFCFMSLELGILDWIMNRIFGELDDDWFDEFANATAEQYGIEFDNIDEDYTNFLMVLTILLCPPFFIAIFIDYVYRFIKFRKK